ncbi:MAG: DUF5320 domain-containing protein [Calditrichaceae bacterium]|nr:DUF5320 domain-containing protein [Calditrichaceae bacterium]MBN2709299.1 DUF5320 domain-containing protein [Calditrichaceae bacterium]RQV92004.1 MAG: hypothetical protein EH224_16710 [Calditrichota bacterium]
MPGGDRSGPAGEGPMTGRRLGYCADYDSPGYSRGAGRGFGRGFGFGAWGRGRGFIGRGFGGGYFQPGYNSPQPDNIEQIQSDVQSLKNGLSAVLERLNKLTDKGKEK